MNLKIIDRTTRSQRFDFDLQTNFDESDTFLQRESKKKLRAMRITSSPRIEYLPQSRLSKLVDEFFQTDKFNPEIFDIFRSDLALIESEVPNLLALGRNNPAFLILLEQILLSCASCRSNLPSIAFFNAFRRTIRLSAIELNLVSILNVSYLVAVALTDPDFRMGDFASLEKFWPFVNKYLFAKIYRTLVLSRPGFRPLSHLARMVDLQVLNLADISQEFNPKTNSYQKDTLNIFVGFEEDGFVWRNQSLPQIESQKMSWPKTLEDREIVVTSLGCVEIEIGGREFLISESQLESLLSLRSNASVSEAILALGHNCSLDQLPKDLHTPYIKQHLYESLLEDTKRGEKSEHALLAEAYTNLKKAKKLLAAELGASAGMLIDRGFAKREGEFIVLD